MRPWYITKLSWNKFGFVVVWPFYNENYVFTLKNTVLSQLYNEITMSNTVISRYKFGFVVVWP